MTTTAPPVHTLPDAHATTGRRRTAAAGALLVLGGATLAASQIVQPRGGDEEFAVSLAESQSRWIAWGLLIMATAVLQLPAVVSLRARTTGPGARLSATGGAITFVSLVALFAFGQSHAELATLVGDAPAPPEVLEAFERLNTSASLGITTLVGLFGFHLGWPLLLAGAALAGQVTKPLGVLGAASVFSFFFGAALGTVGEVTLFVLAAVCLSAVGLQLLLASRRESV